MHATCRNSKCYDTRPGPVPNARAEPRSTDEVHLSEGACEAEQGKEHPVPAQAFILGNPLAGVPSVLALPDLRQRVRAHLRTHSRDERRTAWAEMLRLDPLAVVRGLRVANASLYGTTRGPWTVDAIAQRLGPTMALRLLELPCLGAIDSGDLEALWLRSLATGLAARTLATAAGDADPEQAYLRGLLYDFPRWLEAIDAVTGTPALRTPGEHEAWLRRWHLPADLEAVALSGPDRAELAPPAPWRESLAAAARLATLAEFPAPGRLAEAELVAQAADRSELLAARQLRRQLFDLLGAYGLDPQRPLDLRNLDAADELLGSGEGAPLEEVLLSVLASRRGNAYRSIVTALLAAGLRYGDFDRVVYAKCVAGGALVLRSKAELSARRMLQLQVTPNAEEAAELVRGLHDERPVLLDSRSDARLGLLTALGADQVLAVALNREFGTPAFLLFDRAARQAPLQLARDAAVALTLAQAGALLKENLLLRRRRERADQVALTDALTGLFNRRMAVQALDRELARSARSGAPLTVLLCDLDHFKRLNDQFGHLVGDQALRAVATLLKDRVRKSDTLARFGGEEFVLILPDTPPEDASVLATRIFTEVERRGTELGLPLTVSIGLTMALPDDTAHSLLARADHALYASKDHGRNRFSVDLDGSDVPQVETPAQRLPG